MCSEYSRESARGSQPSRSVARGGVGEQSAPRSCRRKQSRQENSLLRRELKSSPEQLRESSRGCEPSRLPIEGGDLRVGKVACPKGKQAASRPTKRNRRFRLVAPGADFFAGGLSPGEKIASLQIPRPEIRRISAESEKGWCGGESVPFASGCAREGRNLSNFQSKRFPQEIVSFSEGVAVAGELAPPSISRFAFIR